LIQTIDPEFSTVDRIALSNFLWTDIMKVDEEKFKAIFSKEPPAPEQSEGEKGDVFESALRTGDVNSARLLLKQYLADLSG
jgi:hypothetical protein